MRNWTRQSNLSAVREHGSGVSDSLAGLKPVYLIYGTEDLLLERALARLKQRLSLAADLDFNSDTFDAQTADVDDVIAASNTLPFGSERRLVIVRDVDKFSKDAHEALIRYAEDPAATTVLVLVSGKMPKTARLFKAMDKLGAASEYAAPGKSEYPREVIALFADQGKTVSWDAAELLVGMVGYDLRRVSVEVAKASAFAGERNEVTRADIEQVVAASAPTSVFELLDSLGDRDARSSLRHLDLLLENGESPYSIHSMLVWRVRDLIAARATMNRGQRSPAALAKVIGRPEWQARRLMRQADAFRPEELTLGLRGAAKAEAEMKTSRDARLVLERLILEICA